MITCRKTYRDIPFAHRQHKHDGHCAYIHGHNWEITLTFGSHELDASGFVLDFGKLKPIKNWLDENLDHACVLNEDDPLRETLIQTTPGAWKPYLVPCCSCEGLAKHLFGIFDPMVREMSNQRAYLISVEVTEDSRNSACYTP